MALVKFVSDKDCQLIIDKELIALIQTDKLIKVTLEPGSYLVEAKDYNNNIIKKYELVINPSDNQLLQNLTDEDYNINNTIEKLKNDSTVRFYNQRAVFCHNGYYGYINSQYRIVIKPVYTFADEFVNNKAFVRRLFSDGEKASIIDTAGNILLEQWYDYIGSNESQILLRKDRMYYVLSRGDYSFVKEYGDAAYDNKAKLIPVYKEIGVDNYYGYIDKSGVEVIPFIYDYAWNFKDNGLAKVKRFGHIHVVDYDGNLYYDFKKKENVNENSDNNDVLYDNADEERKLSKVESVNRGFVYGIYERYPIKEGDKWGIGGYKMGDVELNEKGELIKWREIPDNKIKEHRCDRILHLDSECEVYRTGKECTLITNGREHIFNADEIVISIKWTHTFEMYEDIRELNNLIIKKNKKYGIIDLNGKEILPIEYDLIIPTDAMENGITGNIAYIWQSGLCSLVRIDDGEILMPFIYEDISVCNTDNDVYIIESACLVKEKGKYGFADLYGNSILPSIYDSIDFEFESIPDGYHYKLTLCKSKKKGLYEYCICNLLNGPSKRFDILYEPQFDDCLFSENISVYGTLNFYVMKDGKWGRIDKARYIPNGCVDETVDYSLSHCNPHTDEIEFTFNSLEDAKKMNVDN